MDTEKQRRDDVRLTEQKRQKQAATCDAYRVANQQRMAAERALEWIGMSKAWLVLIPCPGTPNAFLLQRS